MKAKGFAEIGIAKEQQKGPEMVARGQIWYPQTKHLVTGVWPGGGDDTVTTTTSHLPPEAAHLCVIDARDVIGGESCRIKTFYLPTVESWPPELFV